jgi:hypothetical protein
LVSLQVEADYSTAARSKNPKRPIGFDRLPEAAPATTNMLLDFKAKKNKKRWAPAGSHSATPVVCARWFPALVAGNGFAWAWGFSRMGC